MKNKKIGLLKKVFGEKKKKVERRRRIWDCYKLVSSCLSFCGQSSRGTFEKHIKRVIWRLIWNGAKERPDIIVAMAYVETEIYFSKLDLAGKELGEGVLKKSALGNAAAWLESMHAAKREGKSPRFPLPGFSEKRAKDKEKRTDGARIILDHLYDKYFAPNNAVS